MVGVDSMAMHLAAMFERPQVALFGPTNPFHWRPRHDRALVLGSESPLPMRDFDPRMKKGDVKLIPTDAVVDAIRNVVRHH
jgi:ADP-heptose:LPS heptosyltransferase